jgi:multiple sugar transport system substrate-binding protein
MEEITFSVFNHGQAALETLQALLKLFEEQYGIHVRLEVIPTWAIGWSRLVESALYRSGPDLSEAGNTWIGDLARMKALHPFRQEEVIEITKDARIFENLWRSSIRDENGKSMIYSIPWTGDTRAVFYRRDLLEKAGVDEATAFIDTAHFEKTISILKESGISMPLALTTRRSSLTIHYVASWVWSAGGDFLSPDGNSLVFDQPRALEGFKAYFRLGRYLEPEGRNLDEGESNQAFISGKAAATLNGYWMLTVGGMNPEVRENMGAVPVPGVPFVGGQDLVIWNHSRHESAALKLIQFLHTDEAGKQLCPLYGLPVSENAWETPPFDTGFYPVFKTAIQKGRGFQGQLWGLVEKRLTDEYADIWADVLKSPDAQLDTIVETRLSNLAHRLQLSLGS